MEKRDVNGVDNLRFMIVDKDRDQVVIATEREEDAKNIFEQFFNSGDYELVELLSDYGFSYPPMA